MKSVELGGCGLSTFAAIASISGCSGGGGSLLLEAIGNDSFERLKCDGAAVSEDEIVREAMALYIE